MLATTLTGWAMAGTGRVPLRQDLLGIEIPLIVQDRALRPLLEESHKIIGGGRTAGARGRSARAFNDALTGRLHLASGLLAGASGLLAAACSLSTLA